jgi:hypothetical protein
METESRPEDGGPAYPQPAIHDESRQQINQASAYGCDPGMSLRDYFAGQYLCGLASDPGFTQSPETAANISYNFADAMIARRKT